MTIVISRRRYIVISGAKGRQIHERDKKRVTEPGRGTRNRHMSLN